MCVHFRASETTKQWRKLKTGKQSHSDDESEDSGWCVFSTDLVLAHLGLPGGRAVRQVCYYCWYFKYAETTQFYHQGTSTDNRQSHNFSWAIAVFGWMSQHSCKSIPRIWARWTKWSKNPTGSLQSQYVMSVVIRQLEYYVTQYTFKLYCCFWLRWMLLVTWWNFQLPTLKNTSLCRS